MLSILRTRVCIVYPWFLCDTNNSVRQAGHIFQLNPHTENTYVTNKPTQRTTHSCSMPECRYHHKCANTISYSTQHTGLVPTERLRLWDSESLVNAVCVTEIRGYNSCINGVYNSVNEMNDVNKHHKPIFSCFWAFSQKLRQNSVRHTNHSIRIGKIVSTCFWPFDKKKRSA